MSVEHLLNLLFGLGIEGAAGVALELGYEDGWVLLKIGTGS